MSETTRGQPKRLPPKRPSEYTELDAIRESFGGCGARCTCGVQIPDDVHEALVDEIIKQASKSKAKRIRVQQGLPMNDETG